MGLFGKLFGATTSAPPYTIHPDDNDLVRAEDIQWWNGLSMKDREDMEASQGVMRFGRVGSLMGAGLSDTEMTKKIRLEMSTFYWRLEERNQEDFKLDAADAKLPSVLGARIYCAIKNGVIDNESTQGATSVNALIRQLIRAGRFDL